MSEDAASPTLPPPPANPQFWGHRQAVRALAEAIAGGRMHHGWLLAGPRGVGKATLAYRAARKLLAQLDADAGANLFGQPPPLDLDVAPDDAAFRQVAIGSHPDLRTVELGVHEKTGEPRGEIPVEDVRRLSGFLATTAAQGGWRVVVVDAAEDLNRSAANALLKQLEEPPARTVFFLVSHVPGRLLPTIRSRCRLLRLERLTDDVVLNALATQIPSMDAGDQAAILALARGSIGNALDLAMHDGAALYRDVGSLFAQFPDYDAATVLKLAQSVTGKRNAARLRCLRLVFERMLERGMRAAATGAFADQGGDLRWAQHGSLDHWLALWDNARRLFERADAVNLDPQYVVQVLFNDARTAAASGRP